MQEGRELQPFQPDTKPPQSRHRERRGFLRRLFGPWSLVRLGIYTTLDTQPHVAITMYSLADIIIVTAGSMDIVAGAFQRDRDSEERARLAVRGVIKIGAGLVPYLPTASAGPVIDAISEVDRNRPK